MALRSAAGRATAFALALALAPAAARAAEAAASAAPAGEAPRAKVEASGLPPGLSLSARSIKNDERDGSIVAEGAVTIESTQGRFQADRVVFRAGHIVEAEGNVLVAWGENRISGTKMVYDMGVKDSPNPALRIARGTIENAFGQVEPEFYFVARKVETIGQDRVILYHASVTTCTQPVPHWSFAVTKASIKLEGYAHLFNLRPKIKKVPFFYLPYLAWPVKRERAPGLLFPEFGSTSTRGQYISVPVFVPLGNSADITVFGDYYTIAGWGGGARFRAIPNPDGYAEALAHVVEDQVSGTERYRVLLKQAQSFLNGFRMVTNVDIVSDFAYYTDYVRNLTYASTPATLGRMTFTRNSGWTSLLVQEEYREQLFADGSTLVQTTYPEIQWRGRSRQVGKTPLYFSFVSSFDWIQQQSARIDADYYRVDAGPTLSAPFSPRAWLDITPTLNLRGTYWTQKQIQPANSIDPITVLDEPLKRGLLGASVDIRGPKLYRLFQKKDDPKAPKYKNTIEPRVVYTYQQAFDRDDQIIVYDEVDRFGFAANSLSYGLASRLITQRPRSLPDPGPGTGERILVPDSDSSKLREAPSTTEGEAAKGEEAADAKQPTKERPLEPIEIASVEVSQTYSFNSILSRADLDGDPTGVLEASSRSSAVSLTGRYNPSTHLSFNLSGRYDVLYNGLSDVSVSGNFSNKIARGLFSVVYRPGLGFDRTTTSTGIVVTPKRDATQLRFQGDFGPLAGRLRLGTDVTMNVDPAPTEKLLPYQRWRLEYYTQCCGFLAEYLINNYTLSRRNEFRFAVDLRGIGKLFDFSQGNQ